MHQTFMEAALKQAELAFSKNEVPVGAVLVQNNRIIAQAHNLCETRRDPTAHAELLVLQQGLAQCDYYLSDTTLYVTLEPCVMCIGAAIHTRVSRIIFGAFDAQAGCCGSVADPADGWFDHRIEVVGGFMEEPCAELLSRFFRERRNEKV